MAILIKSIYIEKFRAFHDVQFDFTSSVVAIAGQNGTMKTTLLGMLAQPFSLKTDENMQNAKTIDGKSYGMNMDKFFQFSVKHDIIGDHKFSLFVDESVYPNQEFRCISIKATESGRRARIRIWNRDGDRKAGSGFMQLPVIFLSMKRLHPIGESSGVMLCSSLLDDEETKEFIKQHNHILSILNETKSVSHVAGQGKSTIAANTDQYDGLTISAGQDNIGQILMAIYSFARLKKENPESYKGGILCIDELESTLFPSAQQQLLLFLKSAADRLDLQIFFTTHSLILLKMMSENTKQNYGQILFLVKRDNSIVKRDFDFEHMEADLGICPVSKKPSNRTTVYTEDAEAKLFAKYLLKKYSKYLDFSKCTLGCQCYMTLFKHNFTEVLRNIVILDADAEEDFNKKVKSHVGGLKKMATHVILLPAEKKSPEQMFYDFLWNLRDTDEFWSDDYTRQMCFKEEKPSERNMFKRWFNEQKAYWGRDCGRLFKRWEEYSEENKLFAEDFRKKFREIYRQLTGVKLE